MKTNEKICLKCRTRYWTEVFDEADEEDRIRGYKRQDKLKMVTKWVARDKCRCPLTGMESHEDWPMYDRCEAANCCPYLLELMVLNGNE
jgi:hypothetical protein